MVKKKNVDEILKELEFDYAYNLGSRDRIKKKKGISSCYDFHNSKVNYIEDIYCDIFGLSSIDKMGKSLIRRLRKQTKRKSLYKRTRKI